MPTDWDTAFELTRAEISDRLDRVPALCGHSDLQARLVQELLEDADHSPDMTIGGLVITLNVTLGIYRTEIQHTDFLTLQMMLPVLFEQLTAALLDDPELRRVTLESLYDTNGIANHH